MLFINRKTNVLRGITIAKLNTQNGIKLTKIRNNLFTTIFVKLNF